MKHYHAMNGSVGCLPDSNEVFDTKADAIDFLLSLFDDAPRGIKTALKTGGYYGFPSAGFGADYCEVFACTDVDCLSEYDF